MPQAMGVSIRTASVRYTEWRDWKTGGVIAKELYDARDDSAETKNHADAPEFSAKQSEAATLLLKQFPTTPHP